MEDLKYKWISCDSMLPKNNVVVETMINDQGGKRNIQNLKRLNGLWFIPGENCMYVYYLPTHWREIEK
jgi:hypothetical protein